MRRNPGMANRNRHITISDEEAHEKRTQQKTLNFHTKKCAKMKGKNSNNFLKIKLYARSGAQIEKLYDKKLAMMLTSRCLETDCENCAQVKSCLRAAHRRKFGICEKLFGKSAALVNNSNIKAVPKVNRSQYDAAISNVRFWHWTFFLLFYILLINE